MRTTLDLPENLLRVAMRATNISTKTAVIISGVKGVRSLSVAYCLSQLSRPPDSRQLEATTCCNFPVTICSSLVCRNNCGISLLVG